jgi:mono/diheme cytochrome c family protein
MRLRFIIVAFIGMSAIPAYAAGNADAGRDLVLRSCTSCHAPNGTTAATDQAPPLSFIARDTKRDPTWIHGWLMDPHPPMPSIMLSRQQVDDIIAYLNTLPSS